MLLVQIFQFTHGTHHLPRASSWTQANRGETCNDKCQTWTVNLPRMQMMSTPLSYLRANAAIAAANSFGSGMVPCAGFSGNGKMRSPHSDDAGNNEEYCFYDGSIATGNNANANSYRLCCCVNELSIPPEDASTGCPFTSSDCDTSDWMAFNPTKCVFSSPPKQLEAGSL